MHIKENETTERRAEGKGRPRNARTIHSTEDSRCLAFDSKCVECTRTNVQIGIGSAEHKYEDKGINDVIEALDARQGNGYITAISIIRCVVGRSSPHRLRMEKRQRQPLTCLLRIGPDTLIISLMGIPFQSLLLTLLVLGTMRPMTKTPPM